VELRQSEASGISWIFVKEKKNAQSESSEFVKYFEISESDSKELGMKIRRESWRNTSTYNWVLEVFKFYYKSTTLPSLIPLNLYAPVNRKLLNCFLTDFPVKT
jgi:hypothetical protein